MNVNILFPSKYVKAQDLSGRNITVEISHMTIEKIGNPPKVEEKPILYFRNAKKGMVLNRTNAMTIAAMYTPETDNWTGQRVTLYPTRVDAFGKIHEVIRIQPQVPPAPKGGQPVEETHFNDAEDVPDDNELDETASPVEPEPEQPQAHRKIGYITKHQLQELNALLNALYGKENSEREKRKLVKEHTNGKSDSSLELTQHQQAVVMAILHRELRDKILDHVVDDDVLNRLLLANNVPSLDEADPVKLTHIWRDLVMSAQPSAEAA